MNFEINLIFLIKPFFYMTKKSRQKFKYLENGKSFQDEIKSIFIILKGLSMKQTIEFFLEGESPTLKYDLIKTDGIVKSKKRTFFPVT